MQISKNNTKNLTKFYINLINFYVWSASVPFLVLSLFVVIIPATILTWASVIRLRENLTTWGRASSCWKMGLRAAEDMEEYRVQNFINVTLDVYIASEKDDT